VVTGAARASQRPGIRRDRHFIPGEEAESGPASSHKGKTGLTQRRKDAKGRGILTGFIG
jgi:hypothetical protein